MKTTKKYKKKSICKTRGRKYRNKNNNKNTRNKIGGGIDTLDKLILNNIKNNQIEDMNELTDEDKKKLRDTYQKEYKKVMFKNKSVPEVVKNSKLKSIEDHIKKYINHYNIALYALNEINNEYKNKIGGGIDTLDKLILNNIKNNQIDDMNKLTYRYKEVMFKNDNVSEDERKEKLNRIEDHIEKYIYHYTIALDALNEIKNDYKFLDQLFEELNNLKKDKGCDSIIPYKFYIYELAKEASFSIHKYNNNDELIKKIILDIYIGKDSTEIVDEDSFVSDFEREFHVPYRVMQNFRVLLDECNNFRKSE